MEAGFVQLNPTKTPKDEEERAISKDSVLSNSASMIALRDEFIRDHNILLALSTHGPM